MPPAANQTRRITIKVDTADSRAIQDIADKLGGINKNTKDLSKSFGFASNAATTFLGGLSIRELAGFSDEILNINNRLLAMSGSQQEVTTTFNSLVGIARETNQSVASISDSYFRMSLALKDANISQGTLLDMTKTISNTFRLSGASTQEAANATVQLGQAFSLGVLRGQDLRSVMSQNVTLTRLLRKEFGNNLLKAAEQGLITVPKLMEILHKNMVKVNEDAKTMKATFEQSAVKGLDAVKIKVFELSEQFDLTGKFAKGIQFAIDHMGQIVTVGTILAVSTFPALATSVVALAGSLGLLNPLMLGLAVGLAGVAAAFGDSFDISSLVTQMEIGFARLQESYDGLMAKLLDFRASITFLTSADMTAKFKAQAEEFRKAALDHSVHARALRIESDAMEELARRQKEGGKTADKWGQDIKNAYKNLQPDLDPQKMLAALNKEFLEGSINVRDYNARILQFNLDKANYKFKEGKENLDALHDAARKVDLAILNRNLAEGALTLDEFNTAVRKLELSKLKEDFDAGKLSADQFNIKMASVADTFSAKGALRAGVQEYVNSIGTSTQQVAGLIKNAFSSLEEFFFNFIKTGQFEFKKFAQGILDDLTKIIIRASIVQPLANAILGAGSLPKGGGFGSAGGGGGAGASATAAHGMMFDGGIKRFAKGGVVGSPTTFGYGSGRQGLMGEAGPEAIIPLKRGSGGDLGVSATITPVNINIINNSGNDVEQRETTGPNGEKSIEILIHGKVRDGFASGKFDKVMQQSYGLQRKGG